MQFLKELNQWILSQASRPWILYISDMLPSYLMLSGLISQQGFSAPVLILFFRLMVFQSSKKTCAAQCLILPGNLCHAHAKIRHTAAVPNVNSQQGSLNYVPRVMRLMG